MSKCPGRDTDWPVGKINSVNVMTIARIRHALRVRWVSMCWTSDPTHLRCQFLSEGRGQSIRHFSSQLPSYGCHIADRPIAPEIEDKLLGEALRERNTSCHFLCRMLIEFEFLPHH